MKNRRIIKRFNLAGSVEYVIQEKHWIFRWWWVDAHSNSWDFAGCVDSFNTLEEAKDHLKYFDGTKCREEVVG